MILVTGSTGNVGTELVPLLRGKGHDVRALVRSPEQAPLQRGVEVVCGDLNDEASLRSAMDGVRSLYLIAFETEQVRHAVNAARGAGVRHIVRQSTIEAGMQPPLGPGKWHREQERLVEQSGCAFTHLRPTMMMSNVIQWWSGSIAAQGTVYFPGGNGLLSPVAPRDIARLGAAVLEGASHAGRAYDVTGPGLLSIADMVKVLGSVLGRDLQYVDTPEAGAREHLTRRGLPEYVVEGLLATLRGIREGVFATVSSSVTDVTGVAPQSFAVWAAENASRFVEGR